MRSRVRFLKKRLDPVAQSKVVTMEKEKQPNVLSEAPQGYKLSQTIDLQNNKKQFFLVNGAALLMAAALVVPMAFFVPIMKLFTITSFDFGGLLIYILRFAALAIGSFVYILLHEFTHGITMKIFGAKKVKFGFNFIYAYAGSKDEYFKKWPYIIIALAPVFVFFIIFAAICPFIYNTPWFWVVYFWQVQNISGAMGDIIVSLMLLNKPKNSYIQDSGTSMRVFTPKENSETNK